MFQCELFTVQKQEAVKSTLLLDNENPHTNNASVNTKHARECRCTHMYVQVHKHIPAKRKGRQAHHGWASPKIRLLEFI